MSPTSHPQQSRRLSRQHRREQRRDRYTSSNFNKDRQQQLNQELNQELPAPTTYDHFLRRHKHANEKSSRLAMNPTGESGRRGFHPWHFLRINFRSTSRASTLCNVLWPFVPAALAVRYTMEERHILIFTLSYIAMVPCANLIGFAGQALAEKLPRVIGMLTEITLGSVVEIVLFIVLLTKDYFYVIKAAILGSILATMLLCLGSCFLVGGVRRAEQTFSKTISETGHGLLFLAGVSLAVPTVFSQGIFEHTLTAGELDGRTLQISRIISILLIIAYAAFVFFTVTTHHGIYDAMFAYDEDRDADKHRDARKGKLTMTECIVALVIAIPLVTIIAITLVLQIHHVIEVANVSDPFMGLILVPLVEKFAEHLTAIDEAWDNQMNLALSHVLGATIQTTLFNAPLIVVVAWGLGKKMDLDFDIFNLAMLILSILTVGRFLQDGKSNYLEGLLLILLYIAIAVSAWYYPNPTDMH